MDHSKALNGDAMSNIEKPLENPEEKCTDQAKEDEPMVEESILEEIEPEKVFEILGHKIEMKFPSKHTAHTLL